MVKKMDKINEFPQKCDENKNEISFDDVRVHFNSEKPVHLQGMAYTQGSAIHIAPGQEKHLGHELGHVVQQKQARVRPATQAGEKNIIDGEF